MQRVVVDVTTCPDKHVVDVKKRVHYINLSASESKGKIIHLIFSKSSSEPELNSNRKGKQLC